MVGPKPGGSPMRARVAFLLALTLLAVAAAASSWAGAASTSGAASGKVEQKVLDQIADNGQTTFWAVLREKANLGRAQGIQNRNARGTFVVNELKKVANQSQ